MNGWSRMMPPASETSADYDRIRGIMGLPGISPLEATSPGICTALERWSGLPAVGAVAASRRAYRQDMLARSTGLMTAGYEPMTSDAVSSLVPAGRGAGLSFDFGVHASPFGEMLILVMSGSGSEDLAGRLAGAAFRNDDIGQDRAGMLADMRGRWPAAGYREAQAATAPVAAAMFAAPSGQVLPPALRLALIGTAFDLEVWRILLQVPMGHAVTYQAIANRLGRPGAARAVGSAVGRNPISFTVPCHRVLRSDGALGGYHWGLTRKIAMHVWEAGRIQ